jgi:hypothetical protein
MVNQVVNERKRLKENEGFAGTKNRFCGLPCSFLGLWLGLRTIKPTHSSGTDSIMGEVSQSKVEATLALEEGEDVIS